MPRIKLTSNVYTTDQESIDSKNANEIVFYNQSDANIGLTIGETGGQMILEPYKPFGIGTDKIGLTVDARFKLEFLTATSKSCHVTWAFIDE
ncbi:MAG: hypothetical protein ACPGJS_05690 [Flammeovirgaceae bacterium]